MLLNKFNPFNKRALRESLTFEYGSARRKSNEESKLSSGIMPRSHRGASPYKLSKDPDESFLDLYSDADFTDLDTQEIIIRLDRNLKLLNNLHTKAEKQIAELKQLQAKQKKEPNTKDREINENLDKRLTLLYELEVKIKSLEQIISKLEEQKSLKQELMKRNKEIADEKKSKQKLMESLDYQITEVKFY
jgi:DNA repair exonuclease SbcCD ATPase subunit